MWNEKLDVILGMCVVFSFLDASNVFYYVLMSLADVCGVENVFLSRFAPLQSRAGAGSVIWCCCEDLRFAVPSGAYRGCKSSSQSVRCRAYFFHLRIPSCS